MNLRTWMLSVALTLMLPITADASDPVSNDKDACANPSQPNNHESAADAACQTKGRPGGAADPEPVEMTVGSPPMISDDTGTPGPNRWEINLLMSADLTHDEREIDLPTLDANYGVGDAIELTFEVPYVFSSDHQVDVGRPGEALDTQGIGHTTFGVKYRFYDDSTTGLSLAVYPQVLARIPDSEATSADDDRTVVILPFLLTKEFSDMSMTANAGVESSAGERRYFASVGIGMRLTDSVALLSEIVGTNLNAADEKHVLLNIGATRKLSDTQSIMGAIGHDVYAGGDERQHLYVTFAYQKLFGG